MSINSIKNITSNTVYNIKFVKKASSEAIVNFTYQTKQYLANKIWDNTETTEGPQPNPQQNPANSVGRWSKKRIYARIRIFLDCLLTYGLGFSLLYLLEPWCCYYSFQHLFPDICDYFKLGLPWKIIIYGLEVFFSTNDFANMFLYVITSPKALNVSEGEGIYCPKCKAFKPIGSWHCPKCNTCIYRREQHCWVYGNCVGLQNKRYYILCIAYCVINHIACTILTFTYLTSKNGLSRVLWGLGDFIVFINPFMPAIFRFHLDSDFIFLGFSILIPLSLIAILIKFVLNVMRGLTIRDRKLGKTGTPDWRKNVEEVFGENWRIAVVWPFTRSPLCNCRID